MNLRSQTSSLDREVMDALGDLISYRPAGASTFEAIMAHVDYRDAAQAFDAAQVIEQDMTVSILMADVSVKPGPTVRIQLPLIGGKTFRPETVRRDESGTHWAFELREVAVA